jgi:hypothetical protein
VVEQEQQTAGPDHTEGFRQRCRAVVHITDGQRANDGVEAVVAERKPVTVGDSQPYLPP